MATLSSINDLLLVAAGLLDQAAAEINEVDLQPRKDNIEDVGKALVIIFEIQEAIYEKDPSLKPSFLLEESPRKESDINLTQCMAKALRLEDNGDIVVAIAAYEEFIALETSESHKRIAESQLKRLHAIGL